MAVTPSDMRITDNRILEIFMRKQDLRKQDLRWVNGIAVANLG